MPTTNPYSYDAPAADINKGSQPSPNSSYVTTNPVQSNSFQTTSQPSQAPASFGGAGSSLATTTDFGGPPAPKQPTTPQTSQMPPVPVPTSWTPPQMGTIQNPAGSVPAGYNSPTPPPGTNPPSGMAWVYDGQGHYGWGTVTTPTQGPTIAVGPPPGNGSQFAATPGTQPVGMSGLPFNPLPPTNGQNPVMAPTPFPYQQLPPPTPDFWASAGQQPTQSAGVTPMWMATDPATGITWGPSQGGTPPSPYFQQLMGGSAPTSPLGNLQPQAVRVAPPTTPAASPNPSGTLTSPSQWGGTPAPTSTNAPVNIQNPIQMPVAPQLTNPGVTVNPAMPTTWSPVMSTGAPPWATSLQGGYPEAAFTNPGVSVPTTQQYWAMNPAEQAAVGSVNWSTNGMDSATFQDYMRKSAPQWNSPTPVSYRSY